MDMALGTCLSGQVVTGQQLDWMVLERSFPTLTTLWLRLGAWFSGHGGDGSAVGWVILEVFPNPNISVSEHSGDRSMAGLSDLRDLFQPS